MVVFEVDEKSLKIREVHGDKIDENGILVNTTYTGVDTKVCIQSKNFFLTIEEANTHIQELVDLAFQALEDKQLEVQKAINTFIASKTIEDFQNLAVKYSEYFGGQDGI